MRLNELKDNEGARKVRKTIGRGIGSGKGKTCGMGHKGQHARCGHGLNGFEGGQTPIYRRLPKRGFVNFNREKAFELDFNKINVLIERGITQINKEVLVKEKMMKKHINVISLINNGTLKSPVKLFVTRSSAKAKEVLEAAGGTITFE